MLFPRHRIEFSKWKCKIILKNKQQNMLASFSFPPLYHGINMQNLYSIWDFFSLSVIVIPHNANAFIFRHGDPTEPRLPWGIAVVQQASWLVAGGSGNTGRHTRQQVALSTSSSSGALTTAQHPLWLGENRVLIHQLLMVGSSNLGKEGP